MPPQQPGFTPVPTSDIEADTWQTGPNPSLDDTDCSHEEILDKLLTRVGYGTFQKRLLIMCGFGWLADNMWLQCVAIILPRVQEHFDVSDRWIGTLSSSLFTGMMFGAFFWGAYSDTRGRKMPFTATLIITSFFGLISSFAFSFWSLCLALFCLGFGVGGNMPTDGALYLEFLPREYHYLLTLMSVFFSLGAVLASILGYAILPYTSCPEPTATDPHPPCNVATQNIGWRILLACAASLTLAMVLIRGLWLKLPETPKFLMSQDKTKETIIVLQDIARINGEDVRIGSIDLCRPGTAYPSRPGDEEEDATHGVTERRRTERTDVDEEPHATHLDLDPPEAVSVDRTPSTSSLRTNVHPWTLLFSKRWMLTTLLVMCIWTLTSMAFTMFNVFLPKYLETLGFDAEKPPTRKDVYWDYMVYSIAGVPGSLLASYLIETSIGRKGTMAASAFGSAAALFVFSVISSRVTMLLSSSAVSFLATLLYAVIYGYTPEVFDTTVRGTAVGAASGLGRVAGIVSPIICGFLFTVSTVLPLYVSIVGFALVGICVLLLPYETRQTLHASL